MPRSELAAAWASVWPEALAAWGFYVRLSPPFIALSSEAAAKEGLRGSFAMIRLADHAVVIDAESIERNGIQDYALEILAHETGHHVYCPANLEDAARMALRVRKALYKLEARVPMIGNLWTDLLINDRLKRERGLRMDEVYRKLGPGGESELWRLYMRTYELLWSLMKGSLSDGAIDDEMEADARLAAGLARSWREEWWRGAGRFAAICLPYLLRDEEKGEAGRGRIIALLDAAAPGAGYEGDFPAGILDDDGAIDAIHPSLEGADAGSASSGGGQGGPSAKLPFEYGQILKDLGIDVDEGRVASTYYRALASPHLIPFPTTESKRSGEPEAEGFKVWDPGDPLDEASWIDSLVRSPVLIPGYTILEREYSVDEGREAGREPIDLDIYIDCSGSMPNPREALSHLALAGTIMALSALRAGASVQATLWSGPRQFKGTKGFTRDVDKILAVITGYIGGGTAFPIHLLRDTYAEPRKRKTHIMIISDDGVTTLFDGDERRNSGKEIAHRALEAAGGGGSMALEIPASYVNEPFYVEAREMGWDIAPLSGWEDLAAYARAFARKTYGKASGNRGERFAGDAG